MNLTHDKLLSWSRLITESTTISIGMGKPLSAGAMHLTKLLKEDGSHVADVKTVLAMEMNEQAGGAIRIEVEHVDGVRNTFWMEVNGSRITFDVS